MKKYNINDSVIIYPNEKGWVKIREILKKEYSFATEESVDEFINLRKTPDGGYKEQLWCIASDLHDMFYNGTCYFNTSAITLCHEVEV